MLNAPIIGEANEFIHLQRMLRQRKDALQISNITLADISGLPEGLINKMMSDPPSKNIGVMSFGLLLQALALKLVVIEDLDLRGKLQGRWVKRKEQQVRVPAKARSLIPVWLFTSRSGRKMRQLQLQRYSPQQLSDINRRAALKRWQGVKQEQRKRKNGR